MADGDLIAFNVASFICALFVLEFGADKFIDHTAIVARRTGISESLIGLLTAGAEWEEVRESVGFLSLLNFNSFYTQLVVVVASVARNRSSLAIGNIVGSAISNILGAFSLGLLFHSTGQKIVFDRSSKIYSLILLLLSVFTTLVTLLGTPNSWKAFGGVLLVLFVAYVASVAGAISRGAITAPEASDSDESDDDSREDSGDDGDERRYQPYSDVDTARRPSQDIETPPTSTSIDSDVNASSSTPQEPQHRNPRRRPHPRSLRYHIAFLLVGFFSICLSGYVISHASATISDEIGISDVLFGVVILSIATTLPEKFIAVLSGSRGHAGILVANTVGSNLFLLTLCMGIVLVVTAGRFDAGSVNATELGVLMASTVALTATVWFGARWSRWIGAAMLIAYAAFLVLEFTTIR